MVFPEQVAITPDGRTGTSCAGIWEDAQTKAWSRIVEFVHKHCFADGEDGRVRPMLGLQIGHAGRKASSHLPWEGGGPLGADEGAWEVFGPMAEAYDAASPVPRAMSRADMERVRDDFVAAALRAAEAGFDLLELHLAHGYLLSTFISGLTNRRTDEWGGSFEKRLRFPLEVVAAVRAVWPENRPLSVRNSAKPALNISPSIRPGSIRLPSTGACWNNRHSRSIPARMRGSAPRRRPRRRRPGRDNLRACRARSSRRNAGRSAGPSRREDRPRGGGRCCPFR